jgi:hypothetical protein
VLRQSDEKEAESKIQESFQKDYGQEDGKDETQIA